MAEFLLALALVVLCVAAVAGWLLLRDFRTVPDTSPQSRPAGSEPIRVVIPARNEAASLPNLLASLDAQTIGLDVVVVDDSSTDDTATVARGYGARVIEAGPPDQGWTGKAWACRAGVGAAGSFELLLFLDADTTLSPGAVDALVAVHSRGGGLVSVQPFHETGRAYEQLSAYFNAVSVMASAAFARRSTRRPMAFGPCLLSSLAEYRAAGGHDTVRGAVLDDVELARAYSRAGLPVTVLAGGRAVRMRSYPGGPRQFVAGWTKNIASGAGAADPVAGAAAGAWVAGHHLVMVGGLSAVGAASGLPGYLGAPPWIWVVAWILCALQLRSILQRLGSFRWWTWALFPVPLLAFDLLFATSGVNTFLRRSVRWRGRTVPLQQGSRPNTSTLGDR